VEGGPALGLARKDRRGQCRCGATMPCTPEPADDRQRGLLLGRLLRERGRAGLLILAGVDPWAAGAWSLGPAEPIVPGDDFFGVRRGPLPTIGAVD